METVETRNDRRWWILAVLCLSVLLTGVDNTIVNVALPSPRPAGRSCWRSSGCSGSSS
jgi:hypothetical protein